MAERYPTAQRNIRTKQRNRRPRATMHSRFEKLEARRCLSADGVQLDLNLGEPPQDDALIGLLLPAVQKVREAAAKTAEIGDLKNPSDNAQIGLLLPAVQKVREAAARTELTDTAFEEIDNFLRHEITTTGLLLPTVQKVNATAGGGPHVRVFSSQGGGL